MEKQTKIESETTQNDIQNKLNGVNDELFILRPYDEKFRTDKWYTGSGQVKQDTNKKYFEVTATYQLKSKIQIVEDVLDVNNSIIADQYKEYGRCVAVVEQTVNDLYGDRFRKYFEHYNIIYQSWVMRAIESDKTIRSVEAILKFLGKDGCDVGRNEEGVFLVT